MRYLHVVAYLCLITQMGTTFSYIDSNSQKTFAHGKYIQHVIKIASEFAGRL